VTNLTVVRVPGEELKPIGFLMTESEGSMTFITEALRTVPGTFVIAIGELLLAVGIVGSFMAIALFPRVVHGSKDVPGHGSAFGPTLLALKILLLVVACVCADGLGLWLVGVGVRSKLSASAFH
jgi:hypothetical protein